MNMENKYSRWFGRMMWAGIIVNGCIAVLALWKPLWVIAQLDLPPATPLVWPRFSALLLFELYVLYMPATQPLRFPRSAVLSVVPRITGVVFFLLIYLSGHPPSYLIFALNDLFFGLSQAILLYLATQPGRRAVRAPQAGLRPFYMWILLPLLLLLPGYGAWFYLLRERPVRYEAAEDHFKYGSIGTEFEQGIPYWIWFVLPRVFPEKLPAAGGYTSLGVVWEESRELPIGFTKQTIGFPRVGLNCAVCHISSYRKSASDSLPTVVLGGTGQTFDAQGYLRFLFACASDSRFTPDILLPEIERGYSLSFLERQLYRYLLIPLTRSALLEQKASFAWTDARPAWGHGRVDPFNPVKFGILELPMDRTIGNSDVMPLWGMKDRPAGAYHWDGLNSAVKEVVISSAIADGSPPKVINRPDVQEALRRVRAFIDELPAPKYPFVINETLKARGKPIYEAHCASCHGNEGQGTARIIPIEEIGTDAHRMDSWSEQAAVDFNHYTAGYAWQLGAFRKELGYLATPLKGLWLRAPYLHNGSVPTLKDLLEPVANRPLSFYRGNDVYDTDNVGFVSNLPQVVRNGLTQPLSRYDTMLPGNGNQGHLYGVNLAPEAKRALLEFMKSL
ncbi:c-type cytochrome [Stigmatella erecta]|uniref:Cytochrome C oxidase, cbb3-type, subunit III n=1 Tax=Stigmatella erecta TaxID=83460 RepID=A0A1H9YPM8_9BACT|nr:c-type cytochrome [Stigmatella erecta]SES71083.1 Cytochrome C oxidase, cbb3-type, subunit III [Stigmatella erecta]